MKLKVPRNNTVADSILKKTEDLAIACQELRELSGALAIAENVADNKRAEALRKVDGKNKEEREAKANDDWQEFRLNYLQAKYLREAKLEDVKSLRQILSALQTISNTHKAEADALSYGQSYD